MFLVVFQFVCLKIVQSFMSENCHNAPACALRVFLQRECTGMSTNSTDLGAESAQ